MIFSDPIFLLIFLPVSVLLHRIALRQSEWLAQWVLVGASLVFYAAWDVRWLPLLLASIVVNLYLGRCLVRQSSKGVLGVGIVLNLIPLLIVKYAGWLSGGYAFADIALPLGISFYTFQQIAFLVDAYQGKVKSVETRHYTLFVAFFSQLIAGPICHHKEMIDQFKQKFSMDSERLTKALFLIVAGLFKKVVVADNLAPYADRAFGGDGVMTAFEAWAGSLAYTFQLLFDFAGYCEMAMGFALLFGYQIPINFNSPYKSLSITEFWRRWHVTLGRWFRDYVYIPLGGNRSGRRRMFAALFVTAFASGIWHGAGFTFLLWGVMHGGALVVERFFRGKISMPTPVALVFTFLFVHLAWVMFRAPSVDVALNVYASLLGANGAGMPALVATMFGLEGSVVGGLTGLEMFVLAGLLWWVWTKPNVHEIEFKPNTKALTGMYAAAGAVLLSITQPSAFLYFQF